MSDVKRCSKCGDSFAATREFFSSDSKSKDGLHSWCKSCASCAARSRREQNPEKYRRIARLSAAKVRRENPELVRQRKQKWYDENPGAKEEIDRRAAAKYSAENPEKRRASRKAWKRRNKNKVRADKRRYMAAKRGQQPAWADEKAIRFFYECCPAGCHVDHIIPLNGETVSGLHVETNLQWLPASDNCKKGNRLDY